VVVGRRAQCLPITHKIPTRTRRAGYSTRQLGKWQRSPRPPGSTSLLLYPRRPYSNPKSQLLSPAAEKVTMDIRPPGSMPLYYPRHPYSTPKKRRHQVPCIAGRCSVLGSVFMDVSKASSAGCMKPTHLSEHNDADDPGGFVRGGYDGNAVFLHSLHAGEAANASHFSLAASPRAVTHSIVCKKPTQRLCRLTQ